MSDIFKAKINNQWVGIPALQGEEGPQGPQGETGPAGATGDAAGINSATATLTVLGRNDTPTVSASVSGPDTAKDFAFSFGFPRQPNYRVHTLAVNSWTYNSSTSKYEQTITSQYVFSTSVLYVGAYPESMDEIYDKVVYASEQGDGYLKYTAYTQPTTQIKFGVMIV